MAPPNLQPPVTDLDPTGTNGPERAIRSATDFLFFFRADVPSFRDAIRQVKPVHWGRRFRGWQLTFEGKKNEKIGQSL